jgi:cytochrome c oxidase subunit II
MGPAEFVQSVLSPAGPQAAVIERLWLLMLWTSVVVYIVVMVFVVVAMVRRRRQDAPADEPSSERTLSRSVGAAVAITVVVLFALLVASVRTGRAVTATPRLPAVTIAVTGHQWWWEVDYEEGIPSQRVSTANEIHIPVGQPVVLKVTSRDVIHSFWAPSLAGKRDLIPGYTTAIWLQADRSGVYRGQCAEFCGRQHAHMAFSVTAQSERDFNGWLDAMRLPAPEPVTNEQRRGRDVFMVARCAGCHTVTGTDAHGRIGPDLTHVASRRTLAAGTLPQTADHLFSWIRNPQASKPGNQMPASRLADEDLRALTAYLETLR